MDLSCSTSGPRAAKAIHRRVFCHRITVNLQKYLTRFFLATYVLYGLPAFAVPSPSLAVDRKHWGFWLAGSDTSPAILSSVPRKFGLAGIQLAEDVLVTRHFRLEYTCDFIPVLVIHQPRESRLGYFGPGALERINQPGKSIWGMGVAPAGFRLNVAADHPLFPFLAISTGGAFTTEKIPYQIPGGTTFNFFFQMGGGLRWKITPKRDLLFGYSWWHMSNGRLAVVNPGVDANLFYFTCLFS